MNRAVFILYTALLLLLPPVFADGAGISVSDSWIRETPPGAGMVAAFMIISNNSSQGVRLIAASSEDFKMVEIHRSESRDGMAVMTKQPYLEVPAGGIALLEPRGYHLMLMKPNRSLKAGDEVMLQLQFDNGDIAEFKAMVMKR